MRRKLLFLLAGVVFMVVFITTQSGCYYDKESYLYPYCDTVNITYTAVVQPILKQQCYSCHSNVNAAANVGGTFISLEDFNILKTYALNGNLVCDMNHESGCNAMPLTGNKVDQCSINKIRVWADAGANNN